METSENVKWEQSLGGYTQLDKWTAECHNWAKKSIGLASNYYEFQIS